MSKCASSVLIRSFHTGHREVSKVCEMLSFYAVCMEGNLAYHPPCMKCKNRIININIAVGYTFYCICLED